MSADPGLTVRRLALYAADVADGANARGKDLLQIFHKGNALLAEVLNGKISARQFEPGNLSVLGNARIMLPPLTLDHVAHVRRQHIPHAIISHSYRAAFRTLLFRDVRVSCLPFKSWYAPDAVVVLLMRSEVPAWRVIEEMARMAKERL